MTEYTLTEQNFRDEVRALATRVDSGPEGITLKVRPDLAAALRDIDGWDWSGAARALMAETAENVIDTGLNGTASNAFEFRQAVEHDPAWGYAAEPSVAQGKELAGQMYEADADLSGVSEGRTLTDAVDNWVEFKADQIVRVVCDVVEGIWELCEGEEENSATDDGEACAEATEHLPGQGHRWQECPVYD
ncbi:UNVERIFIED_CONTAM: hypothetical protein IGO34_23305, partial [Salmonella enterica subsp. enterica serovar Weltevreden]